jgi:Rod binding domain-containing protein
MGDLALSGLAVPPQLAAGAAAAPMSAAELASRGRIRETAQSFEASFLSSMLQEMFEGTDAQAPFGGGPGETMFRSFLTEAMAKQMARGGGVGVAASVEREMLKLQGLK